MAMVRRDLTIVHFSFSPLEKLQPQYEQPGSKMAVGDQTLQCRPCLLPFWVGGSNQMSFRRHCVMLKPALTKSGSRSKCKNFALTHLNLREILPCTRISFRREHLVYNNIKFFCFLLFFGAYFCPRASRPSWIHSNH
jgi:hypothetical protein